MSNQTTLRINCDMGEWDAPHVQRYDSSIMPWIDLCNIACGAHAGNKDIIIETVRMAIQHQVGVGAHPGYYDRVNFGRTYQMLPKKELYDTIIRQLDLFFSICDTLNVSVSHVKMHGALYHACNENMLEAEVLIDIMLNAHPETTLIVGPNSLLEKMAAKENIKILRESFIDRSYNDDLSLVSRSEKNAVISNVDLAKLQYSLLASGQIKTISNKTYPLCSDTACIHGDNPNCLAILKEIKANEAL